MVHSIMNATAKTIIKPPIAPMIARSLLSEFVVDVGRTAFAVVVAGGTLVDVALYMMQSRESSKYQSKKPPFSPASWTHRRLIHLFEEGIP